MTCKIFHQTILVICILLYYHNLNAQPITGITSTTPSICFNDGTISVQPSGGIGPYTLAIISGPNYSNYNYPVILPQGSYNFLNVPRGTFTIEIKDINNNTSNITATVMGSYTFPSLTVQTPVVGDSIIAKTKDGIKPYSYAISSISATDGFGQYQSDSVFNGLCNGTYWIRVIDSCGNIFTSIAILNSRLSFNGVCIDFTNGNISIDSVFGTAPITYTATHRNSPSITVSSGNLPFSIIPNDSINISLKDSCGRSSGSQFVAPKLYFNVKCPFDGTISISGNTEAQYPFSVKCTNCPNQNTFSLANENSNYIYQGSLQPNTSYQFSVIDNCGNERIYPCFTQGQLKYTITALDCNSIQVTMRDDNGNIIIPDSIAVSPLADPNTSFISTIGYFNALPQYSTGYTPYNIIGYAQSNCSAPAQSRAFDIPYRIEFNRMIAMDSMCTPVLHLLSKSSIKDLADIYSIETSSDTFYETPASPNDKINFYGLPLDLAGYLVSDSGCRIQINTTVKRTNYLYSTVECVFGKKIIFDGKKFLPETYTIGAASSEGTIEHWAHIYFYDSLGNYLMDTSFRFDFTDPPATPTHEINIADTGFIKYKVFIEAINANDPYLPYNFDSICPLDTGTLYVTDRKFPYPLTTNLYKCPSDAPPRFTIYGGAVPYRIEVPGVDTFTINENTALFPATAPGQYTIFVYDDCGVSRSITLSLIDTCTKCVQTGAFETLDTIHCLGDTIRLFNNYTGEPINVAWYLNGIFFGDNIDTLFVAEQKGAYNFQILLATDSCNDSATITYYIDHPEINLVTDKSKICNDVTDSTLVRATLNSEFGPASFLWSNGYSDTSLKESSIFSFTSGTVSVLINRNNCIHTDSINVEAGTCITDTCGINIALPNAFSPNNDGNNDTYEIITNCSLKEFSLTIYNRWGQRIFSSLDPTIGWDGTFEGKPQPNGVYHVSICVTGDTNRKECYSLAVALIR